MEAKEVAKTASKSNDTAETRPISSTAISSGHPTNDTTEAWKQPSVSSMNTMKATPALPSAATIPNPSSVPKPGASEMPFPPSAALKLPSQNLQHVTKSPHTSANIKPSPAETAAAAASTTTTTKSVNSGNDRVTVDRSHKPLVPTVAAGAPQPVKTNLPSHPSLKLPSFQPVPKKIPTLPTATTTAAIPLDKAKMQPSGMKSGMPLHPAAPPRAVPPGGKIPTPSQLPAAGKPPSTMAPPPLPTPPLPPPPPPVVDESALIEEAIRKARAPLTDKYSPFIVPSDRTLSEARNRLRKAVEQTRKLRAAFTERVYGKYRVCLRPPPTTDQIFNRVMSDPARTHRELNDEIKQLKAEKEIEKKEAQKLNAEMAAANNSGEEGKATAAAVNAETAEQLMFISAGLSLIILPEHDVAGKIDMSGYPDRAPINPETGQRVRSISAAAAAAGEVMLDRARKGATMRVERQRRRQLQIMAGEDPEKDGGDTNYSRLSLLSNATITKPPVLLTKSMIPRSKVDPTKLAAAAAASSSPAVGPLTTSTAAAASAVPHMTPKNFKRPTPKQPASTSPVTSPMVSAKAIRARVQATMSNNTLLSLNPSAEELRTDGKCGAATMAMMERGVGGKLAQQQQQQSLFKYKHPFPNSMGARRRGDAALALPSLLSAKERRMRSPAVVEETNTATTTARANRALRDILGQYVVPGSSTSNEPVRKRRRTKISFLHGLEYPQGKEGMESLSKDTGGTIDPILTFNVLKAIGLIQPSSSDGDVANGDVLSVLDPSLIAVAEKRALGEDGGQSQSSIAKLKELRNKFASKKRTFVEAFFAPQIEPPETEKPNSEGGKEATTTTAREVSTTSHQQNTNAGEETKSSESSVTVAAPQALSIRGGGQELTETDDKTVTKSEAPVEKNAKDSEATASLPALNDKDKTSEQKATKDTASTGAKAKPASDMASRGMVLVNPQAMRADQAYRRTTAAHQSAAMQHGNNAHKHPTPSSSRGVQGQQHQGSDTYHHPSAANALQLAHQLHHASASMQRHHASGDLEAYIGGLRAQTGAAANYEWSQIAALGLSPHRAAMMNFTVQGRARALLARGQQNAAAAAVAHAAATQRAIMGSAYASGVTGRFPHVSGHAAMMNSSAALMGHSGINQLAQSNPPVGVPGRKVEGSSAPTPASVEKPGNKEKRDATSRTDEKDDVPSQSSAKTEEASRKRKLSTGSAESTTAEKRRNTAKGAAAKTETDAAASGNNINLPSSSQKVSNPNVLPKPSISGNGVKKSDQKVPGRIPGVPPGCSKQSSVAATIARLENGKAPPPQSTSGMQFYVPPAPPGIPSEIASLVLASRVFEAIDAWESGEVVFDPTTIIDYLLAVGIAVPIPKALVVNPLKERISSTAMKNNSFSNIPASSREVIVALILLWLWRHHEDCFQKTFAKSGRIDVDPECKWLINAAVDRSVLALSQEIGKPGSPLSVAFTQAKSKGSSAQKAVHTGDTDRPQGKTTKVDLISASVVSRSLLAGTRVDDKVVRLFQAQNWPCRQQKSHF
eukprot:scaffold618_cov130-Cylindrotheca_fusiformis.AAC.14